LRRRQSGGLEVVGIDAAQANEREAMPGVLPRRIWEMAGVVWPASLATTTREGMAGTE
jgi:hypothetical protein